MPAVARRAGNSCPIIVHNHFTINGNGNVFAHDHSNINIASITDKSALLETIRAQAATISQMLNTIKEQAAQLEQLKEDLRRATSTE